MALVCCLFVFLLGFNQDPFLRRHIKTDSLKYEVYISKTKIDPHHLNDSLFYHWCKSQKVMATQGGIGGDILHGDFKAFYHDGQLAELGRMRLGLKHGVWKTWYANGQLKSVYHYRKGKKHGTFAEYDLGGQVIQAGKYKRNALTDEPLVGLFGRSKPEKETKETEAKSESKLKTWFKAKKEAFKAQREKQRLKKTNDQD